MPVTTHKLQPTTTIERVPVRKLIEVPGHKWVDQEYIDVEEQELVRDKVVWVKKVIPEKYIGQVEVKKTRKVKVCRVRPEIGPRARHLVDFVVEEGSDDSHQGSTRDG